MSQAKSFIAIAVVIAALLQFITVLDIHAQLLTNVYYIDAQPGVWYAVNTGGQSYRVFYIDASGNTVYVTAYWWDLNSNYIIFQSPVSGRIYLRQESIALATLNTLTWFSPQTPSPTIDLIISETTSDNAARFGTISFSFVGSISSKTGSYSPPTVTISYKYVWNIDAVNAVGFRDPYGSTKTYYYTVYAETQAYFSSTLTATYSLSLSYPNDVAVSQFTLYSGADEYSGDPDGDGKANIFLTTDAFGLRYGWAIDSATTWRVATVANDTAKTVTATAGSGGVANSPTATRLYLAFKLAASTSIYTDTYSKDQNGVITASNGNKIIVYDSLGELGYTSLLASSSSYDYFLYTQDVMLSFGNYTDIDRPIVIKIDTSQVSASIRNPNPAVYISDIAAWTNAYIVNYGSIESFLVFQPPFIANRTNINISVVYNYPLQYSKPQLQYTYAESNETLAYLALDGTIEISNNIVKVNGTVDLSSYIGSTIVIDINNSASSYTASNIAIYSSGDETILHILGSNATISGYIEFTHMLILYNTQTLKANISYSAGALELRPWPINKISYIVSGSISGSWAYRIPIYVTLAELPSRIDETGFVFRVLLPVSDWVSAGLLCSGLEDLIIVDSAGNPQPFYILKYDNAGNAVTYIRYTSAITSSSIVLYVLLKNNQLCGSGSSFQTLSVFDAVNPLEFVDVFGYNIYYTYLSYNMIVYIPTTANASIKIGKSYFDAVAINSTHVYEQHGSNIYYTAPHSGLNAADEVLIYIDRQGWNDVLVYRNGNPMFSFRLSDFRAEPAYYVGYRDAVVYAAKMLLYSWSIGQVQGSFEQPKPIVSSPTQSKTQQSSIDFMQLFMALVPLIILAVVMRIIQNPPSPRQSGGGSGGLPW